MADATQGNINASLTPSMGIPKGEVGHNDGIAMGKVGHSYGIGKVKVRSRKVLATPQQQGSETRKPLELRAFVVGNQVLINDVKVPLYSVFVLNPGDSELYVKVSKSECIMLSSRQRFSAATGGYLVSLVS